MQKKGFSARVALICQSTGGRLACFSYCHGGWRSFCKSVCRIPRRLSGRVLPYAHWIGMSSAFLALQQAWFQVWINETKPFTTFETVLHLVGHGVTLFMRFIQSIDQALRASLKHGLQSSWKPLCRPGCGESFMRAPHSGHWLRIMFLVSSS